MNSSEFILEETEHSKTLWTQDRTKYLCVWDSSPFAAMDVHMKNVATQTISTARTIEDYEREFGKKIVRDPSKQYAEVGAGFSEFAYYMSILQQGTDKKPIVIDPLDYELSKRMLTEAFLRGSAGESIFREYQGQIVIVLTRCMAILDETKVRLYNTTLGEALRTNPELVGSADVVIDAHGAWEYTQNEHSNRMPVDLYEVQHHIENITHMERLLLKDPVKGLLLRA